MNWAEIAASVALPVFPIAITWNAETNKWQKKPLTTNGHKNASFDVSLFDWSRANGFGIPMGNGLYAIDFDDYKQGCAAQEWVTKWQVPMQTRTHQTVSGGRHLIYRLPAIRHDLGTRQGVVPGLDTRGAGGWIAFGEGYQVIDASEPVVLPNVVCHELVHGQRNTPTKRDVTLKPVTPVDANAVLHKLRMALTFARPSLRHRWAGGSHELHNISASGFDMSIAKLLANARFTYSEIYWLMTTQFPHGVVARDGLNTTTDRQVKRAAARATQGMGMTSAKMSEVFGYGR